MSGPHTLLIIKVRHRLSPYDLVTHPIPHVKFSLPSQAMLSSSRQPSNISTCRCPASQELRTENKRGRWGCHLQAPATSNPTAPPEAGAGSGDSRGLGASPAPSAARNPPRRSSPDLREPALGDSGLQLNHATQPGKGLGLLTHIGPAYYFPYDL